MSEMLMKVQVGPVQEFIAQARSTRDMWAGSYLLSWLTASAMKVFKEAGCKFIFPTLENQPLYEMFCGNPPWEIEKSLIPTLPNVFMMLIPEERVKKLSEQAENAVKQELTEIGEACWEKMLNLGASKDWKTRWDDQLERFPIFNWQAVPLSKDWKTDVELLGKEMAARRNTRDFDQWGVSFNEKGDAKFDPSLAGASKDVLSGKEEIIGNEAFWKNDVWKKAGPYGAMNCIKRLFPSEVLERQYESRKSFWEQMRVEDTRDLAEKNRGKENSYIAIIVMDGDKMGAALKTLSSAEEHTEFSRTLAVFAEQKVSPLVEQTGGRLIYAGGDDVLAMCPADQALNLAEDLRNAFRKTMEKHHLDASCGIAVGHYQFPLQRIVEEARAAETRAKNQRGRAAFAMSLLKRSGEIIFWGGKWESPALELYRLYTKMAEPERASSRFPYALAALLEPYRLAKKSSIEPEQLKAVVLKEYQHVRSRQLLEGSDEDQAAMDRLAEEYVAELFRKDSGGSPPDFPNLFLASTFMNRQRGEN